MISDLVLFIKGKPANNKLQFKNVFIFYYILYLLFVFFYSFFLKQLDEVVDIPKHKSFDKLINSSQVYILTLGLLVVPVIEELTFRLILKVNKINFCLSVFFICYFFSNIILKHPKYSFDSQSVYIICFSILIAVIAYCLYFRYNISLSKLMSDNWFLILLFSTIGFALVHYGNLQINQHHSKFIAVIVLVPQLVMGLILSYLRVRFSLFHSMFAHGFFNLLPVILFVFSK